MTSLTDLFLTLSRLIAAIKEVETAIARLDIATPVKTAITGLDIAAPVETESKPRHKPSKPAVSGTKAVDKPALRVGQTWLKRDGKTTSISLRTDRQRGKSDHFFTSSEGVEYAPSGFHQPGKFSRLDLVKLVQDAPDDEIAEPVQHADPAPDTPASPASATPVADHAEHAAVMLEGFTKASKYMLGRALAQFCGMAEVQAKNLLDKWPNRPVEVARYINPIHAQNTINGLTRVKGVQASIKMVTIK